ncbi:MAG TPA: type II toxin-antitoxin system RelE/ParE family toxin [Thermodesulfobacteriota bacterium]|nr:type II toxin-antitoxin system RelE/ParE family toxin [Thermodesulfobacteriota bacterium]
MSWTIKVSSNAEKYHNKLDKKLKQRIKEALVNLSKYEKPLEHPHVTDLTGDLKDFYRLRVGDYRIIFGLIKESKIIAVVNIFPRGDAYR